MVLVVLFVIQGFSSDIGFSMVVLIRLSLHPQYKNIFLLKATVEELDYQCRNTLLFSRTSFHRYVSVKLKVIQPNDLTYSQLILSLAPIALFVWEDIRVCFHVLLMCLFLPLYALHALGQVCVCVDCTATLLIIQKNSPDSPFLSFFLFPSFVIRPGI